MQKEEELNKEKILKEKTKKDKNKDSKIKNKSKQLNVINIDLENNKETTLQGSSLKESSLKEKNLQNNNSSVNNIDLFYLTNKNQNTKNSKLDQILSNNCLLKEIYDDLENNINSFKEQITKYNSNNLDKLLENSGNILNYISNNNTSEKFKLYYLLYILNLILYLKEKKIKNSIKNELKCYSNNYIYDMSNNEKNFESFNINSESIKYMSNNDNNDTNSSSKKLTNLDLFVVRKSNKNNKKILPQKRQ